MTITKEDWRDPMVNKGTTGMSTQLSAEQIRTLEVLFGEHNGWRSSYPGLKLGTLNSLSSRKLVEVKYEAGSMAFPATSIKWRINNAGRAALAKATP